MSDILPIVMPKWGLSMKEGTIVEWLVAEGEEVAAGDELAEVETDKINGDLEATATGTLRRIVAETGTTHRVQSLLAVVADPSVQDAAIDAFIAEFPEPPEDDEDAGAGASAYDYVEVDGRPIHYSRLGEGETVLLLHGFGGDIDNWLFTIGPLAEGHEVIAIDLPGHGESSLSLPATSVDGLAGFVWSVVDALEVGEVSVIGHSLGGAIAGAMAIQQPGRVRSLALIASAGLGPDIDNAYLDGFVTARSKREMKQVAAILFADPAAVTRSMIDDLLRYKRVDGVEALLAELRDGLFGGGSQSAVLVDGLAPLGKPVLVVWGADDRVIPAGHAQAAAGFADVHVLDGAGHMVQMERANDVNRLLAAHLS